MQDVRKTPDLSIIIGTYNTKNLVKKTLSSIYKNTKKISFEIILIDDASSDGTFEYIKKSYPQIKLLKNKKNLGYSKTYNIGTKLARGRYVLHLNSDVYFTKDSHLDSIARFMDENPKVGIAGCKVLKNNGSLDLPCRHAVPTLKNTFFQLFGLYKLFPFVKSINYYMTYLDETQVTEVGGILGAFMLIRRELFKSVGYLDENFFIYCEDTDYCYRAKKKGWKIFYYPKITVKHMHGATTRQFRFRAVLLFHRGMLYYYKKHYAKNNNLFINLFVYFGITVRFLLFLGYEVILYIPRLCRGIFRD